MLFPPHYELLLMLHPSEYLFHPTDPARYPMAAPIHYLHIDFRLPNAIISSIVCGLSVAYSQFYIERKKGMCKSFWIVAGIFTIMAFVMILMIR